MDVSRLDKAFSNSVRLGIMSLLMVEDHLEFNSLKDSLKLTDGNLASHIKALEKIDYIKIKKSFIGKKPNTIYFTTSKGKKAFLKHLDGLESILKKHK